ncbi:uncharacterized protein LY89DRAFT_611217 [Mollisia scopiformis]|uniref:Laccase n=1 Tax=Mollisia scopiformis TaxID=149040 RepID=A0A194XL37_MOLSC|nr:uncharacterized protein LY89DRAFT_611217 [Mollisia scopiformis]KUJ20809.1 hypothetical protein LY89DRAFT_611217 [Mollisia scopiformis]
MFFPTRRAVCYSVTVVVLVIGIYTWLNIGPYHDVLRIPQYNLEQAAAGLDHERANLAIVLRPEEHVEREPKTVEYRWNITTGVRAPDGVTKQVYLINGEFPGPLVEAKSGDELVIEVYNGLEVEGTAIHWHGLKMQNMNNMDGVVGLTQSPILPGESFTYKFTILEEQAGTFWYHAHSELQRADGLYGPLIVHERLNTANAESRNFEYDEDLALMVGDWYHRSTSQVQDYYTDWTNFGNEPAPDSMLLNGKGKFECSMAVRARPLDCKEVAMPKLQMNGRRTRLRIINTGALTGFTMSMSGYTMTVITLDGGNEVASAPAASSVGVLYPGERMDVIIEKVETENEKEAIMTIKLDKENLKFKNFALTPIQHFPISATGLSDQMGGYQASLPLYDLVDARSPELKSATVPTAMSSQTILLYTKVEILAEYSNIPKGFINRTSWNEHPPDEPPMINWNRQGWDERFVPQIKSSDDEWVEIVLNNMDEKGHPFHLHGYSFHVLATHKGKPGRYQAYNPFDGSEPAGGPLNTVNPIKKDTVYVPGMGYVVLRFRPDNPGLWLFHCHVIWHHAVGMAMAFQVGGSENGFAGWWDGGEDATAWR